MATRCERWSPDASRAWRACSDRARRQCSRRVAFLRDRGVVAKALHGGRPQQDLRRPPARKQSISCLPAWRTLRHTTELMFVMALRVLLLSLYHPSCTALSRAAPTTLGLPPTRACTGVSLGLAAGGYALSSVWLSPPRYRALVGFSLPSAWAWPRVWDAAGHGDLGTRRHVGHPGRAHRNGARVGVNLALKRWRHKGSTRMATTDAPLSLLTRWTWQKCSADLVRSTLGEGEARKAW